MTPATRTRCLSLLIFCLFTALSYAVVQPRVGTDDANITQNYALNLWAGWGYVYYRGGPPVEGSTSLLWTLVNVACVALSPAYLWILQILTGLLAYAVWCVTLRLRQQLIPSSRADQGVLTLVPVLIFFPAIWDWLSWSLMDTTLWVLLLLGGVSLLVSALQQRSITPPQTMALWTWAVLLPLTRPEGGLMALGMLGYGAWALRQERPTCRGMLVAIGLVGLTVALVTAWRMAYFGVPLPNTLYAKVSWGRWEEFQSGLAYLAGFLRHPGVLFWGLALIVATRFPGSRWRALGQWGPEQFLACVVVGIMAVYGVAGGDHFYGHRQLIPVILIGAVLASGVVERLTAPNTTPRITPLQGLLFAGLMMLAASAVFVTHFKQRGLALEFVIAEAGRTLGTRLDALTAGEARVGVITAGGVSITYPGPLLDLVGLNSPEMAHAPRGSLTGIMKNHVAFNAEVLRAHPPEILLPRLTEVCDESLIYHSFFQQVLRGVMFEPWFQATYRTHCVGGLIFFQRRDYTLPHDR